MDTDTMLVGDCLSVLHTLPADCARLVYADPPFYIDLPYPGYRDRRPRDCYLAWTREWLAAVRRVQNPAGTLFVQIAPRWAGYVQVAIGGMGLHNRNTIIWAYNFGPHQPQSFGANHQQIFYFTARGGSRGRGRCCDTGDGQQR